MTTKKYFNKKKKQKIKANLKKYSGKRILVSKRRGGIIGVSAVFENRNIHSTELINDKKEIL